MFDPKKFTVSQAKPLPVFLLLDVSGSMNIVIDPENTSRTDETAFIDGQEVEFVEGGTTKLQLLNDAVMKMIASFTKEERMETEFRVSVITFGDAAQCYLDPTSASRITWSPLTAEGETAMGEALLLAKGMIEDKEVVPSRAYRPIVALVSDGIPNVGWESAMNSFVHKGRSSKCTCLAMGIGEDADHAVLSQFIENTPYLERLGEKQVRNEVFSADDADSIHEFFQRVTMTAEIRTGSIDRNVMPAPTEIKLDGGSVNSNTSGTTVESSDDDGYW